MSVVDVRVLAVSNKPLKDFVESIADILQLELITRDSEYQPYMFRFYVGQEVYVECYPSKSGHVYSSANNNWGIFDYRLVVNVVKSPTEANVKIQVPLPINSVLTDKENYIQAHIIAGKYIFRKLKESGQYRILLDQDFSNPLDVYDPADEE